ncbi:MAG: aminopeptidase [Elusimicrobia bacterium]|nr:aminopeptidase [Elusimicrobiota bacterium]
MKDPRNETLARLLVDYSTELKKGDTLYLEVKGRDTLELAKDVLRCATQRGATTFWFYNDESLQRHFVRHAGERQFRELAALHLSLMKKADAYIGIRGSDNPFDLADMPAEQMGRMQKIFFQTVHMRQRIPHTRWVVLRYPNNAMAQLAKTSQEAFADFYYDVCCADYPRMDKAMDRLVALLRRTDKVRLTGRGTDLSFSIKGIPAIKCAGKLNIPDGEVYTAPVRGSVNGTIRYNTPTLHDGIVFHGVTLTFKDGKVVKASADAHGDKLNAVLDTDAGARYVGEFALGVNPFIREPMLDTLFDEKIAGSFHFTPGACYDDADNGNKSAVHWDLVFIQRPEYGGGEMWFDGKLVRKDGAFTDRTLERQFSKANLAPAGR